MTTLSSTSDVLVTALQVLGTVAFAVSGAMAAARGRMDWFGVVVLGTIVAVGGGTLRDVLLGDPASWTTTWWPLPVAAVVALLTIPVAMRIGAEVDEWHVVLAADALGLAVFTVLGADKALDAGTPDGIAIVLGVVTGIFGGIFRDVLRATVPVVFGGQVYALAAAAGATAYVVLLRLHVDPLLALWLPVIGIFALRMLALVRSWSVPAATVAPAPRR